MVFNELFRKLNGSLNLRYEGQYELLMFGWTGMFFKSYDLSDARDIETSITLTDATVGYMPWAERFYILAGGRYYRMNVDAKIKENDQMTHRERSKGWFDLFVGARYEAQISNRVSLLLRGDVGGFGLGSDLSWNTSVITRWSISNFAPELGYRVWGVDYNSGSGDSRFEWDVVTQGVSLGMTFFF